MYTKKEQSYQNNSENSYTERKAKHKPAGDSLRLNCSFDETKNRCKFYRRKDCLGNFCEDLKELVIEIINFKGKEMTPLTDKEIKLYEQQKACYISKGKFCYDKNKKSEHALHHKVKDHWHYTGKFRGVAHNICNLRYKVLKKIPKKDYHFIIKQLTEDFKGQFECFGENTEKYIAFSVPIQKDDNSRKITYKLKFIDSYRFIESKLSDLVDNLSEIGKRYCSKCMERSSQNVNLLDLKMIDYITNAKNIEKDVLSQ